MSRRPIVRIPAAALAVFALVASACSGDDSDATASTPPSSVEAATTPTTTTVASTTTSTSDAPTTVASSTTSTSDAPTTTAAAAGTTTTAAPTTAAPSTTAPPPRPETGLTLTSGGVQPFGFGDVDASVIDGLTIALGPPTFDGAKTYSVPDGEFYLDDVEEEGFAHPIGRTVCFVNDLCVQFGGATVDTLTFTGWEYSSDAAPVLDSVDGITVGSNWNDFADVITVDEGGCYTVGYGRASGVELTLLSTGDLFQYFDDDGDWVIGDPSPADVSVVNMSAGALPYFLFDDC